MLIFKRLSNKGFTLLEMSIVVVIVGVLATMSAPSLAGFYQKIQLENALTRLSGAIRETQLQAVRLKRSCSVVITPGVDETITGNCLVTGDRRLAGVHIHHSRSNSIAPWTITFDEKGRNQSFEDNGTVVLNIPQSPRLLPKCLVMSIGIGLHRVGAYEGRLDEISATSCLTL